MKSNLTLIFISISTFPLNFTVNGLICTLLPFQNTDAKLNLHPYNSVFWTTAVEFQFYLIFPFLHRMLIERGPAKFLFVLGFTMLARLSATLSGGNARDLSCWTILGRLDQFVLGMIAATVVKHFTLQNLRLRWALPFGGMGLLGALFFFNRHGGLSVIASWKIVWPPIEGFLWATIIIGYVSCLHNTCNVFWRLMASIGTISYSIYLTHLIVITLVVKYSLFFVSFNNICFAAFLSTLIIILPVTIIVSFLTYYIIEKPFLELRIRYMEPLNNECSNTP
jgi:peptidoglycan/LPS O-acetylase OafA/YrhL